MPQSRAISLSPALRAHVDRYARRHQVPVNKALHFAGIPMALVASLGLLGELSFAPAPRTPLEPSFAWLALSFSSIWYLWNDWRIGVPTSAGVAGCYLVGCLLPHWMLVTLLMLAVVLHFIGHVFFERKAPAVFTSPLAVLEAPVWLIVHMAC